MAALSLLPASQNISVSAGDTLSVAYALWSDANATVALDYTDFTAVWSLANAVGQTPALDFTSANTDCTAVQFSNTTVTDSTGFGTVDASVLTLTLTPEQTSQLPSPVYYALRMDNTSGWVGTILTGSITTTQQVGP